MKVLVLGVTGHVGNAVARELLARGHAVTGISRSRRSPNLNGLKICHILGDTNDSAVLDSWVRGHDAVVDAAAPYPIALSRSAAETARLLTAAERRTHLLLKATRKHSARLIYVSSFSTLRQRRLGLDHIASELIRRLHPYFAVKARIEELVLAAARDGQPVAIANPTGCLGPWDCKERARCFVPSLLNGEIPASTDHMLNVIDVRDLAKAIVTLLEQQITTGPIPFSGYNISNDMLFRWICEIGGVKPPRLVTPIGAGIIGTYLSELGSSRVGGSALLPALIAMLTYIHGYVTPSEAQMDLGVRLRPLSATLVDSVAWYRLISYC